MKPQTISVLLCGLLITTLAHDYLHHHHPQSQNRVANKHEHHSNRKLNLHSSQNRDANEGCHLWCPPHHNQTEELKIVINATSNIAGLANITANYGIAFDISANIVLLLNGKNGHIIIIDIESQTGVHVTHGRSPYLWVASQRTFEAYINSLTSLKPVLEYSRREGTKFNVATPNHEILQLVSDTLVALGTGQYIRKDLSNSVLLVIGIADRLIAVLRGNLAGFFELLDQTTTLTVEVSLGRFVEIFEALGLTFGKIKGGVSTFKNHRIRLDLRVIIDAKSGIEIIAYIINVQIVAGIDVIQAGPPNGFSLESLFGIIYELSDSYSEYGRFVRVISLTIDLTNGTVAVGVLIPELIKFVINGGVSGNVRNEFSSSLRLLLNVLEKLNKKGEINSTVESIRKLISGNLTLSGLDINSIEEILTRVKNLSAIDAVIEVLLGLRAVVNVAVSIPTLFFYIVAQLNNNFGVGIIISLFPTVKIDESVRDLPDGTILTAILKSVNTNELISTDFDLVKILKKLPVIKDIYVVVSGSLDGRSHGSLKLDVVIRSGEAGGVVKKILTLLGDALHIDLSRAAYVNLAARVGHHHHRHEEKNHIRGHIGQHLKHGVQ